MTVEMFAALADPVRLEIVEMLAERELSAGEIASRFTVSGPAVSRHLRVLRESGIATCRVDAQRRIYALNGDAVARVEQWAQRLLDRWRDRFEALGQHLDSVAAKRKEA